jgi:hypothetical protein
MGFRDFFLSRTLFCRDMSPSDAKKVALGDADPVTLLRMEDINSTFVPRVPLNLNVLNYSRQDHGKRKGKPAGKSASEGILHFFGKYNCHNISFPSTVVYILHSSETKSRAKEFFPTSTKRHGGRQCKWQADTSRCHGSRSGGQEETT